MRKISDLIKEDNDNKTYKYTLDVQIEGTVNATSESEAGELADKIVDEIDGVVDYKMTSLDEVETIKEYAENITENLDDKLVAHAYEKIITEFESVTKQLATSYHKAELRTKLEMYFSK